MSILIALVLFLVYLNAPVVVAHGLGLPGEVAAVVPLMLVVPIAAAVLRRREPVMLPKVLLAAVVLLLVHLLSSLLSARPHESLPETLSLALEGVLLALLLVNAVRDRQTLLLAAGALVGAGALMGLIVILQQLLGPADHTFFGFAQLDAQMTDDAGRTQYRLAGPVGETNRFAQVLAVLIPVAVAGAVTSRGAARALFVAAALLILGGIGLTFSRGAILALAVAAPAAVLLRLLSVRHVLLGAAAVLALLLMLPQYAERAASIASVVAQSTGLSASGLRNADSAARGRLTEMKAAGVLFLEHPVIGAGPGLAPVYYPEYAAAVGGKVRPGPRRSHNLVLQLAAETGVLGLTSFVVMLLLLWRGLALARRRVEGNDPAMWALLGALELSLLIFLLTSLFLHAAFIRYFWLLVGLCASATVLASPRPVLPPPLVRQLSGAGWASGPVPGTPRGT